MAFPSVRGTPGSFVGDAVDTSATPITYASPPSGNLLLLIGTVDATRTITGHVAAGFTEVYNSQMATSFTLLVAAKVATGSEGTGTFNLSWGAAEDYNFALIEIQDWEGTLSGVTMSTGATGTSTTPNPDSVTAAGGSGDNLFLAFYGIDNGTYTASAYPTSYTGNQTTTAGAGAAGSQAIGYATRQLASASDDPATFTTSSAEWAAFAIAVEPAAAGGATPKNRTFHGPFGSPVLTGPF